MIEPPSPGGYGGQAISRDVNTGAGQDFTGLAAAVQLRLRVARFLFYRDQLSSLHYTPHEDYRCTATLMSGLPGAGNDTWLARSRPEIPIVALDAIRNALDIEATDNQGEVIQAAREQCREPLRAGQNFAFNATNITRRMRQRWIDSFADYGARIETVYIEPPTLTECHSLSFVWNEH